MNKFVVGTCEECYECKGKLETVEKNGELIKRCTSCKTEYGIAIWVKE